jgi:HAD superfamily hydrolase (TIGR01509 family)
MLPPAACLFDLDGLLLDTEPLHARAWREAAGRFGARLSDAQVMQLRGRRRIDCARQVLTWIGEEGGTPVSTEELLALRQPIAESLLPGAQPMPGAPELVGRCLELGIPMAIVTSSGGPSMQLKTAPHPWLAAITMRVHGDEPELQAGKPAPDVYLLAARRLGVDSRDCWAFEDSPAGARSALAAGCRVHVLTPPGMPLEGYPEPVIFLSRLAEVGL